MVDVLTNVLQDGDMDDWTRGELARVNRVLKGLTAEVADVQRTLL